MKKLLAHLIFLGFASFAFASDFKESWKNAEGENMQSSFVAGMASEVFLELLLYIQNNYHPNIKIFYSRDRLYPLLFNSGYQYYSVRNLILEELRNAIKIDFNIQVEGQSLKSRSNLKFQEENFSINFARPFIISTIFFVAGSVAVKLTSFGMSHLLKKIKDS